MPKRPKRPSARPKASAYEDTVEHGDRIQSADTIADGYDTAVENVFPDQPGQDQLNPMSRLDRNGASEGGEAPDIDQFVAARPRLADHLEDQTNMILRTPADRLIARYLIDNLNEAGYLAVEPQAIADQLGRRAGRCRGGAGSGAGLRSGGGVRAHRSRNASPCSCARRTGSIR